MSFVGKLDEFQLSDLLQIISTNEKSGKLNLTRHDAQGVIVFRHGKIIYAASSSARETLGFLLLSENLISEKELLEALEVQHQADEEKRLGSILVEQGVLPSSALERVVRGQLEKVLTEFMDWNKGFFKFERLDLPDMGEIGVDAEDFILPTGLRADQVLVDLGTALEERSREEETSQSGESASTDLPSLKSIMNEIRSPEFTGESTVKILEFARKIFTRGVLFFVRQGNFTGMQQFGVAPPDKNEGERLRRIKIPLDQPSLLSAAANSKAGHSGPLEPIEWNLYLMSKLGGNTPSETAALPLVVNDDVLLVLYGDNAGSDRPLGSLDELELLLIQAGLAMEKRLLEKRIEHYHKLRGEE
ncbi:MAG: DUF4388 domain-containing protein [Acidobacteriota bacterium]|nr:DUF4388 domain-containing protein [Acidobacteriota bacterium]